MKPYPLQQLLNDTLTDMFVPFQEFADYFVRQLQTKKHKTKDSKHKAHTDPYTTTDVDPFAEII